MSERLLRVRQLPVGPTEESIRDFDADEWSYRWVERGGAGTLVLHLARNLAMSTQGTTYEFVEFSLPVSVELIIID
jgi:hypothetical protein